MFCDCSLAWSSNFFLRSLTCSSIATVLRVCGARLQNKGQHTAYSYARSSRFEKIFDDWGGVFICEAFTVFFLLAGCEFDGFYTFQRWATMWLWYQWCRIKLVVSCIENKPERRREKIIRNIILGMRGEVRNEEKEFIVIHDNLSITNMIDLY